MDKGKARRALCSKGFEVDKSRKRHIFLHYHRSSDGERTAVNTHVSKGRGEIKSSALRQMPEQVGLDSQEELNDLIECPMSRKQYEGILRAKNLI